MKSTTSRPTDISVIPLKKTPPLPKLSDLPIHLGLGYWFDLEGKAKGKLTLRAGYTDPRTLLHGYTYVRNNKPGMPTVEIFDIGYPKREEVLSLGWDFNEEKSRFIIPTLNPELHAKILVQLLGFTLKSESMNQKEGHPIIVSKQLMNIELQRGGNPPKWHIGVFRKGKVAMRESLSETLKQCKGDPTLATLESKMKGLENSGNIISYEFSELPGFGLEMLCTERALRSHALATPKEGADSTSPWEWSK